MARILIVEDEPHLLRVMSMWLARNGHEVLESSDGIEALEVLDRERVDLIVSDVNMPRLDGIELMRTVREERALEIPCVLLSARCDHARLQDAIKTFNVQLYPKPFSPSRLVAQISHLLDTPVA